MPKKTAKSLEELDKKMNPEIVRLAKENAKRERELDKLRREKLVNVVDVGNK